MSEVTTVRILKALRGGPLFEGALRLILDNPADFDRSLRDLERAGGVERVMPDNPYTWRIAS